MTSGGLVADDRLMSNIGGYGALANGLGRVFWGNLVDFIGFFRGCARAPPPAQALSLHALL